MRIKSCFILIFEEEERYVCLFASNRLLNYWNFVKFYRHWTIATFEPSIITVFGIYLRGIRGRDEVEVATTHLSLEFTQMKPQAKS